MITITGSVVSNGTTSIILKKDSPPTNGLCNVFPTSGFAMITDFNITCSNWASGYGIITKYEYYGKLTNQKKIFLYNLKKYFIQNILFKLKAYTLNKTRQYTLAFDSKGSVLIKLPAGESTDMNRLYLYVRIFNTLGTITVYNINTAVNVAIQNAYAMSLASNMSSIMSSLQDINQIQSMFSIINSISDKVSKK